MSEVRINTKTRFSDRVGDYSQYRPGYPPEAIDWIIEQASLEENFCVVDVGSGTGIFTGQLLGKINLPGTIPGPISGKIPGNNSSVIAIEPNDAMREESDRLLGHFANYQSVAGSAEHTLIDDSSVDLITAAQAFHWFTPTETRAEFQRILKPDGHIALMWNRRDCCTEFQAEYEDMLVSRIPEYTKVTHANSTDQVIESFLGSDIRKTTMKNSQAFNLEGLKGRLLSSSYCPALGQAGHTEIMRAVEELYDRHASNDSVSFDYQTQIYFC